MNPDLPHSTGVPSPTAPKPLALTDQPVPSQPMPERLTAAQETSARAKKLVEQYQNNPFMLNSELDKLKTEYLAKEFHITIVAAEN